MKAKKAVVYPAVAAFKTAEHLAKESRVMSMIVGPLDVEDDSDDTPGAFAQNVAAVRKALIDAYWVESPRIVADYDGSALCEKIAALIKNSAEDQHIPDEGHDLTDEFWQMAGMYQEAGYIFGVAVGLLLAKSGGR